MGSVKDLTVLTKPGEHALGIGLFRFSDRYSVFDWGEMPDQIPHKGKALCILGAYFFEKLEMLGVKTHYLGLVENGEVKKLSQLKSPAQTMKVQLVRVVRPTLKDRIFDYSVFQKKRENFLIPLEVIYRNSLPSGASVFRRLKEGSLTLQEIGLKEMPRPGQKFEKPVLDVSTKLETIDRYLSWKEAEKISGLKAGELETLQRRTLEIAELITQETARVGLFNEDGKVEFAFDEKRNLMLVDVLGTPDECRFTVKDIPGLTGMSGSVPAPVGAGGRAERGPLTFEGIPVSKEVARIYYRETAWFKDVEGAKKKDKVGWKEKVKSKPNPLPPEFLELVSFLYQACANEITQREWFRTPPLKEILLGIKGFLNQKACC
ncbi:MAG: phosphoribosylaminoimidazolesuccinocarboxamide synthase [Chlamydiae bacterium]|nr:phosphoribosylaminoimidazolesuccinocarboxamide synthase [Chlamydiota bacterium]MBI3266562.1 phosphoribosylaminoimidazolesuccinocarboxamide synthase [Chlamydiota bacterium]